MSDLLYNTGVLCGNIAFFSLAFLIFSGDTARYWNRFIGLDKIIKFQRKFSYFVAVFVLLHPTFFILSTGKFSLYLIPNFAYIPISFGILSLYTFTCIMIASKLYKMISYKAWQYIHILTYILFFFALYHVTHISSGDFQIDFITIIVALLICVGIVYRTVYKIRTLKTTTFKVKDIVWETLDTFTLTLKGKKDFQAGQFFFLRINNQKLYARHPFTASSSPSDNNLSFTIKVAGRFTKIAKELKENDIVLVDGPFGNFIPKPEKNLVFIAGGVGITPFMSVLRDHVQKNINQNITLFYGSKTEADIIFKKDFDKIKNNWFKPVYILGEKSENMVHESGYMGIDILIKHVEHIPDSLYYICGPEVMKNSIKKILKDLGVPRKNIFVEDFFW
jgi:predicted ferric reductase